LKLQLKITQSLFLETPETGLFTLKNLRKNCDLSLRSLPSETRKKENPANNEPGFKIYI